MTEKVKGWEGKKEKEKGCYRISCYLYLDDTEALGDLAMTQQTTDRKSEENYRCC